MDWKRWSSDLDDRFGPWMDRLHASLFRRHAQLAVPRRPVTGEEALAIFRSLSGDEDVERYCFQEASIEAGKMVVLGYFALHGALDAGDPEACAIAERAGPSPSLRQIVLASVEFWAMQR